MVNEPSQNTAPPTQKAAKVRNGCLTIWLVFIIIGNIISSILLATVSSADAGVAGLVKGVDIGISLWIAVCAAALFMWKKWGFYGFILAAVISIALNIALHDYVFAISPVISVAILYGVLQIGGPYKGWNQLE